MRVKPELEEQFWKQRAKINWIGDKNTNSFMHLPPGAIRFNLYKSSARSFHFRYTRWAITFHILKASTFLFLFFRRNTSFLIPFLQLRPHLWSRQPLTSWSECSLLFRWKTFASGLVLDSIRFRCIQRYQDLPFFLQWNIGFEYFPYVCWISMIDLFSIE